MKKPIYKVSFEIKPNNRILVERGWISVTTTQCTVLRIGFDNKAEFRAKGKAHCSPSDIFDINTGRKLALKRAISGFPKALRTKIWKAMHAGTIYISG